jgi:hypothetical protein
MIDFYLKIYLPAQGFAISETHELVETNNFLIGSHSIGE